MSTDNPSSTEAIIRDQLAQDAPQDFFVCPNCRIVIGRRLVEDVDSPVVYLIFAQEAR